MSAAPRAVRPIHVSLERAGSDSDMIPLPISRLTDQQRLAVLLQAAGLLSLLDRAGWMVPEWSAARVGSEGGLRLPVAVPGRASRPAQETLRELLGHLFRLQGSPGLAGKGLARKAARRLLDRWFQSLAPVTADEGVAQILDEAPFLWEAGFASARVALAGGLPDEPRTALWVAGPASFRLRLLNRCHSLEELRSRLAAPGAKAVWEGDDPGDPRELAAARKWRAAVGAWSRRPPATEPEAVEMAAALVALGRSEAALAALDGLRSAEAETVRARCQLLLGQIGAAASTLRRVRRAKLPGELAVELAIELAEIASRVFANTGKPGHAAPWLRRALDLGEEQGGSAELRAGLVAAGAAWDRGDAAAMETWLDATRSACGDPELAWRWHQVRSLGLDPVSGRPAVQHAVHAGLAIRLGRRKLTRHEAAGLWNELGVARARVGDLAGAERAFLHAARHFEACDGPRKATLALPNLAEIRLRRGRLAGVREILERTVTENRLSGNVRGLATDTGLRARFELALGRPDAALRLCREALALGWDTEVSRVIAARALGWLKRPDEAAAELSLLLPEALAHLEPEERPALRALAGDPEGGLREAAGTPFEPLWQGALAGRPTALADWDALAGLEPYRAARLIHDLDLAAPGCAPSPWLRSAASVLRSLGALAPAERLEARDQGPWLVLSDYLERPAGDPDALARLVEASEDPGEPTLRSRAFRALAARDRAARETLAEMAETSVAPGIPGGDIVGESPSLQAALERISRFAPGDLPLLILGESGTGKELAARRIHRLSLRARSQFVPVNCAALSETLILSDLFGHARGAFTGADRSRQGFFETAHGGTVFLDEIGDLPLSAQGLLLRVLQEGEVRPLGEAVPRKVNVRVLAATHRDLSVMVAEKTFRQDLYFRLRVGSVTLPPLRERGKDVLILADRFLARHAGKPGKPVLSKEARTRLLDHDWPGNIRELQNVLSVALALAGDGTIEPVHLELPASSPLPEGSYHQELDSLRRRLLSRALERNRRNLSEVARHLGLSRQAVSYLMKRLKIE